MRGASFLRPGWIVLASIAGSLVIVSVCSLFFRGHIAGDYLITGLITSFIVATVAIGLLNYANQRELERALGHTRALQHSENKYRQLYDSTSDALLLLDERGFFDCNKSALKMFGLSSKEDVNWRYLGELSPARQPCGTDSVTLAKMHVQRALKEGSDHFEWLHRRVDNGVEFHTEVLLSAMEMDGRRALQMTVRDISERKFNEQQIHQLAFYDALTHMPNRRLLMDRLHQAFAVSDRNEQHGALMFLDLDHFKTLNDTRGHEVGDLLLVEVAARLASSVRDGDTVARLGGDEFVVVLETLSMDMHKAAAQAERVAEKMQTALNQPYPINGMTHHISPSIGIAMFKGSEHGVDELLKHADIAMYQAKAAGRNAIRFYDPVMQSTIEMRADLETELRVALQDHQFELYYQVQVDSLNRPLGAEALLRWNHPVRGTVPPSQFIPLLEDSGQIVPVGLWVLQTACEQLRAWQANPVTCDLVLAINVSAKQFRQRDFVARVQRALHESGAKPSRLKLELTESVILENIDATIAKMRELKLMGVSFSMDDFGTGYSSLQYLKQLPLDQVKIDRSFVNDIVTDVNDAAIVQAIIAMSAALGLNVIAEGVETDDQRAFLNKHGCHAFQGYLFGKPVPVAEFAAAMARLTA